MRLKSTPLVDSHTFREQTLWKPSESAHETICRLDESWILWGTPDLSGRCPLSPQFCQCGEVQTIGFSPSIYSPDLKAHFLLTRHSQLPLWPPKPSLFCSVALNSSMSHMPPCSHTFQPHASQQLNSYVNQQVKKYILCQVQPALPDWGEEGMWWKRENVYACMCVFASLSHGSTVTAISPWQAFAGSDWITPWALLARYSYSTCMSERRWRKQHGGKSEGGGAGRGGGGWGAKEGLCAG